MLSKHLYEKSSFSVNFDLQKVMTIKQIVVVCYKQRDRYMILKRLPKDFAKLQSFMNAYN